MSEFKGTKGEWIAEKNSCYFDVRQKEKRMYSDGERILCVSVSLQEMVNGKIESISHSVESEANAKLIACAPEMLEFLTRINEAGRLTINDSIELDQLIKKATE